MATHHLSPSQFQPPGDADAKAALKKQLKKSFRKQDLAWLDDDSIRVDAATRVDPSSIDWDQYPEWRASRQLDEVVKTAKKQEKKNKEKPAVLAQAPGSEKFIVDGHHHVLAEVDRKKNPFAFVVHVPTEQGPWQSLHDKQKGDTRKDDFGKTDSYDRND